MCRRSPVRLSAHKETNWFNLSSHPLHFTTPRHGRFQPHITQPASAQPRQTPMDISGPWKEWSDWKETRLATGSTSASVIATVGLITARWTHICTRCKRYSLTSTCTCLCFITALYFLFHFILNFSHFNFGSYPACSLINKIHVTRDVLREINAAQKLQKGMCMFPQPDKQKH